MECPRGSMCKESTHQVITIKTALEWFSGAKVEDLPLTVQQQTAANGRIHAKVFGNDGELLYTRG